MSNVTNARQPRPELVMTWIQVTDADGRQHMEAHWVLTAPTPALTAA